MGSSYTLMDVPSIVGAPDKHYVIHMRDLPPSEKPRERLHTLGPTALSPVELLSVILGVGTRKEGLLSMTARIVREYGERNVFSQTDVAALAVDLSIPEGKAAKIVAVGELGRRFFAREQNGAAILRRAHDAFEYVTDMRALLKEHLRGLYLNTHYQVIHDETISMGTVDANMVHPREVFRPAIACAAVAVILVHNHPSGVLTPSTEDILITRRVREAGKLLGIELVDHVIVTREGFISIPFT